MAAPLAQAWQVLFLRFTGAWEWLDPWGDWLEVPPNAYPGLLANRTHVVVLPYAMASGSDPCDGIYTAADWLAGLAAED